jgi:two-component system, NarL family, invasion response regulator UvrY
MKKVLIADDHAVTRRGVRDIVLEYFEDAECVEVDSGDAVVACVNDQPWDLLLLDVMMPGMPVLDVLAKVRAARPKVPILVLTASNEIEYVVETMKAGANGLIHKHHAANELISAIRRVGEGGNYLHPDTAIQIASALREDKPRSVHDTLSERELDIFRRIALGRSIKEIAFDLALSDKTVATYLARIRTKTGLTGHVDIARYAMQNGLVD